MNPVLPRARDMHSGDQARSLRASLENPLAPSPGLYHAADERRAGREAAGSVRSIGGLDVDSYHSTTMFSSQGIGRRSLGSRTSNLTLTNSLLKGAEKLAENS